MRKNAQYEYSNIDINDDDDRKENGNNNNNSAADAITTIPLSPTITSPEKRFGTYSVYSMRPPSPYASINKSIASACVSSHNAITQCSCSDISYKTILPITRWLPQYQCSWFKQDILAGLTVAILLVPQSLAYAELAGLPPVWGLYASVMPLLVYALFSTSAKVAVGPVAPTAIMVASAVNQLYDPSHHSQEHYEMIALCISFVAGVLLIFLGLLRLGGIITLLTRPVMTGFIMSAALIILVNQFRSLFGMDIDRYPVFYQTLFAFLGNLDTMHGWTSLIGILSWIVLFLPKFQYTAPYIPKWLSIPLPLIVIVTMTVCSYVFDFEDLGIDIVGDGVQAGFPAPKAIDFGYLMDNIAELVPAALVVAVVSYMGSIALAKDFDTKSRDNYRREKQEYMELKAEHLSRLPLMDCISDIDGVISGIISDNDSDSDSDALHAGNTAEGSTGETVFDEETDNNSSNAVVELREDTHNKCSCMLRNNCNNDNSLISKPLDLPNIKLNPNMEFIAYGFANLVGSFFGSQVVSASFSRSALNFEMLGHTQVSTLIQALICALCLMFCMPLIASLPKCTLAAVVAISVYRLIKNGFRELSFLLAVSRAELIEFGIAVFMPLIVGLEMGLIVAMVSSILMNFFRNLFANVIELGQLSNDRSSQTQYVGIDNFENAKKINDGQILILELRAELSFANQQKLCDKIQLAVQENIKYMVISLSHTQHIDTTAFRQMIQLFSDCDSNDPIFIALAHCRKPVREMIFRFGKYKNLEQTLPSNVATFISTHDAVKYCQTLMQQTSQSKKMNISVNANPLLFDDATTDESTSVSDSNNSDQYDCAE